MRNWKLKGFLLAAFLVAGASVAYGQYRPAPRKDSSKGEDSFEKAVDLERFRKGNADWDTQELIASGIAALHQDHLRILRELEELKSEIRTVKDQKKE